MSKILNAKGRKNPITKRKMRAVKTRAKIRELKINRLSVHRTLNHIYAQVIDAKSQVLASASTLEPSLRSGKTGNKDAAKAVGKLIAERARDAGIDRVAFDRSGNRKGNPDPGECEGGA